MILNFVLNILVSKKYFCCDCNQVLKCLIIDSDGHMKVSNVFKRIMGARMCFPTISTRGHNIVASHWLARASEVGSILRGNHLLEKGGLSGTQLSKLQNMGPTDPK